jgi:hypothetical protein
MNNLLMLVPTELLLQLAPLLIAAGAISFMGGAREVAAALLFTALIVPVAGPLAEAFLNALPPGACLVVMAIVFSAMARGFLTLFIGRRATDDTVSRVLSYVIIGTLRVAVSPFRVAARILTSQRARR